MRNATDLVQTSQRYAIIVKLGKCTINYRFKQV